MGATLDALHRLQIIDIQLRSIRGQIESKHRSVETQRHRIAALESRINEDREQIRHAQCEADRHELDRQAHEDHISKLRETLNKAKTNKEYAAALTELNTDKADADMLEDSVLASLTQVDELKVEEAASQAAQETERVKVTELERIAAETASKFAYKVADLESKRSEIVKNIAPSSLDAFDRASEKHDGEGMAAVEQMHPKRHEYICSGCNMSLPLEIVNALQSREDVLQCPMCSRILYLDTLAGVPA